MKTYHIEHTPMKILLQDYSFDYFGVNMNIKKWFCFDGASVPRLLSFIFKPNDTDTLIAAMIHDYLYSKLSWVINRKESDIYFMWKLPWIFTRLFAYIWVRLWGWLSFKKDTNYKKYKEIIKIYREVLINNN